MKTRVSILVLLSLPFADVTVEITGYQLAMVAILWFISSAACIVENMADYGVFSKTLDLARDDFSLYQ